MTKQEKIERYVQVGGKWCKVDRAPDLVEVVRCKDCKYRYKMACHQAEFYECSHIGLTSENGKITHVGVTDDYFCADGERKEQNDE